MSLKVDPTLMKELKHYGLKDASKCFHCGNCTAVCPLSKEGQPFPRKLVKYAQMGLREKLVHSPEPWLCYYCGDCSDRCPRGAEPGETMMALRRWLTAQYDFTGFARRFYTSEAFEIGAISLVALLILVAFLVFTHIPEGPGVKLNTFAPNWIIEILDWLMAIALSAVLLTNVFRCACFVMTDRKIIQFGPLRLFEIPLKYYIQKVIEGVWNMISQWPFKDCTDRVQWVIHLLIFTGYSSVFLMVVVGLRVFQREAIIYTDPAHWRYPLTIIMTIVGYYATAAILAATTYALIGRLRKSKPLYKNSHPTDWVFLVLLQLTTLTGILVHATIFLGWPVPTYVIYVIHLMVAIPMLVLEVPFAKWAHLAYRPTVLYLMKVKELYERETVPALAPKPAPVEEPAEAAA
ncbi:MAG: 4Fe-4S dicluster domain-containing protein [Thermodesulfobacteriota bacterium]